MNNRNKIINYLNKLSRQPNKKELDNLIKRLKLKLPKNVNTKAKKMNFIKRRYKIDKRNLINEMKIKDIKDQFKKYYIYDSILNKNKKEMFNLLQKYLNSKHNLNIGYFTNIGRRDYQEDRLSIFNNLEHYVSAVYDGHAGNKCSTYLKNNFYKPFTKNLIKLSPIKALFKTFLELDNKFLKSTSSNDGSTANVLYFDKKTNICYLANTGDSRAILYRNNGKVEQISEDHKPNLSKEKRRIIKMGGFVKDNRTNGNLAMSRAFGDKFLKDVLTVEPDIFKFGKSNVRYILQASDGLFDVMSNREICNFINTRLTKKKHPHDIARELVTYAIKNRYSQDNTSVILTLFN